MPLEREAYLKKKTIDLKTLTPKLAAPSCFRTHSSSFQIQITLFFFLPSYMSKKKPSFSVNKTELWLFHHYIFYLKPWIFCDWYETNRTWIIRVVYLSLLANWRNDEGKKRLISQFICDTKFWKKLFILLEIFLALLFFLLNKVIRKINSGSQMAYNLFF